MLYDLQIIVVECMLFSLLRMIFSCLVCYFVHTQMLLQFKTVLSNISGQMADL